VSRNLIEKARSENWNPEDKSQRNEMAVKGYFKSFNNVTRSIELILNGENAGVNVRNHHKQWYSELFSSSIEAGILKQIDMTAYRDGRVFIRGSKHTAPDKEAVKDMMPALFELLEEETEASVRAVLGHFMFVFTHPYMDGNGRIGRFLMNAMLASGGYPWAVISVNG